MKVKKLEKLKAHIEKVEMILKGLIKSILRFPKEIRMEQLSFRDTFDYYRKVLDSNNRAVEIITEMSDKLGRDYIIDIHYIKSAYSKLYLAINKSIRNFNILTQNKYPGLHDVFKRIDNQIIRIMLGFITKELIEYDSNSIKIETLNESHKEIYLLKYISPLNLVDPMFDNFMPEGCQTIHDIIRFIHVKSVAQLFDVTRNVQAVSKDYLDNKLGFSISEAVIATDTRGRAE